MLFVSIHRIRAGHEGDREAILAALICRTFRDHTMVFVQTKKQAHRIHILLGLLGIKVCIILFNFQVHRCEETVEIPRKIKNTCHDDDNSDDSAVCKTLLTVHHLNTGFLASDLLENIGLYVSYPQTVLV
jgi:hypothetical protein